MGTLRFTHPSAGLFFTVVFFVGWVKERSDVPIRGMALAAAYPYALFCKGFQKMPAARF